MPLLSIHTMTGDPADLLARKARHMDPVVDRLAPAFGALMSVTATTADGILTVNVWDTAEGAAEFGRHPDALAAQQASGLPRPSTFERFTDIQVTRYDQG